MTIKASGRSALVLATAILTTGLFVCFAGPSQAAADEDDAAVGSENAAGPPIALNKYTQHGARHGRRHAHRNASKVAMASSASTKAAEVAAADTDNSTALPPWVADAHAQMAAEAPLANGKAMSARANDAQATPYNSTDAQPAAGTQIVSADQLNDLDRALQESKRVPTTFAMASAEPPPVTVGSNESSTWDRTSLIGKIFMGFGALLTMASAVRMFMA
jgi:hypothetical protein